MLEGVSTPSVYRSNRWPAAVRLLVTALGGLVVTGVVGVGGFIWIVSRVPIQILVVIILEAGITGLALAWLVRRLRVRSLLALVLIAATCGLAGSSYCLYSFYVREAKYFHERKAQVDAGAMRKVLPLLIKPGTKEFEQAAEELDCGRVNKNADPFEEFDHGAVYPTTHHHGLYGYLLARGAPGAMLILLHLGMVVFLAVQFGWVLPRESEISKRLQLPDGS